ncbi:MAG: cobalt transporter CbiM [Calditrichaeota bacterium]|nr:cobalt transporter CbiM [Calditrichota bacterium]
MHISDGVLNGNIYITGYAITSLITAYTLKKVSEEDIPKISVVTSVFFVASLIHIKIGPTSVHLVLNGLVGILLGMAAFPSILIGLLLQAFIFGHGGITSLGVNAVIMGVPALIAHALFGLRKLNPKKSFVLFLAFICGGISIFFSTVLLSVFLILSEKEFETVAKIAVVSNIPIMIIEAIICLFVVKFLLRVKPQLLE